MEAVVDTELLEGARTLLTRSRCSKKTETDNKKADSKPDTAAKKAEGEKA